MPRMLGLMCAAMLCHATIASAQMAKKMDPTVTVTGCVAEAATGGGYMLSHASHAMKMEKDKMAMEKDKMAMDKMATLSYVLSGGENLRAHLGHKVEIVGTPPAMMDTMGKDAMAKDTMAKDTMKPASLTVKSLTMVSTTCP